MATSRRVQNRGGDATAPTQIPAAGWKDVLQRTKDEVRTDNVSVLAGGVAFYWMLSLFPFAIAALSVYGLVADPDDVTEMVQQVQGTVPDSVGQLLQDQLGSIAESSQGSLTFGLIGSVLFALWSASKGASALIKATNVAFDETETRGFLRLRAMALLLTLVFLVVMVVSIALIAVVPNVVEGTPFDTAFSVLRWPALAVVAMMGLGALYRYAPDRDEPRWQWVSLGAVVATVLWLVGSSLFSVYANNFGNFNETYGTLSAVIVLLLWLSLTAFVILLGAEINAETEHQTARDSTTGPERPRGERDAYVADTVGERVAAN
ncbi:MAG: YihY/virulence factor BrkB family protein [Actinobacteria bacterium]|nr:YihY/virulence factor BrkB family protein [Actinomycetota bacterium]